VADVNDIDDNVVLLDEGDETTGISRRGLLKGAAAMTAFAALPRWASPLVEDAQGATASKVVIAKIQDIPTLDSDKTASDAPRSAILAIYDTLVDYDIDKKIIVPRAALKVSIIGGKQLVFHLRKGIKFTNGEPLDANAVQASFQRTKDPATASLQASLFANVDSVEVIDKYTSAWHLKGVDAILLQRLASWPIMPAKYIAEHGDRIADQPVGSGPYKFKSWQRGYELTLERNEAYWGPKPAYKQIGYRTIATPEAQLSALLAGQIQIAADLTPQLAGTLKKSKRAHMITKPRLLQALVLVDQAGRTDPKGPMTDVRVRRALNMGVDVDGIIKNTLQGNGTRIAGGANPLQFGFDPKIKPYKYDPNGAKQLLSAAGYGDGLELRMISQNAGITAQQQTAEAVQAQLAQIGVKVSLEPIADPAAVGALVRSGKAGPMIQFGNGAAGVFDVGASYAFIFRTGNAFSYYSNPTFDSLYLKQTGTYNKGTRQKILSQMQQILHDDAAALFEWAVHGIWGVSNSVQWPAYSGVNDRLETAKPA
jgi:peptide/nickel transport system substrate-binding protein